MICTMNCMNEMKNSIKAMIWKMNANNELEEMISVTFFVMDDELYMNSILEYMHGRYFHGFAYFKFWMEDVLHIINSSLQ